jgi:hypothetical protein
VWIYYVHGMGVHYQATVRTMVLRAPTPPPETMRETPKQRAEAMSRAQRLAAGGHPASVR